MFSGGFNIDLHTKTVITRLHFWTQCIHCHFCQLTVNQLESPTILQYINNFFINEPCNFDSGIIITDISDNFPIFFTRKNSCVLIHQKNVNKGVNYRLVNQNTLSALDEILAIALTNFDDIISNVNINEAM